MGVVSLLHTIGENNSTAFTDEKGKTWTAYGDAKISTAQAKFGTSSGYFDGNGDYITAPSSDDFECGSGDYTWAWWEYRTSAADNLSFAARDASTIYVSWLLGYSYSGALRIYMSGNGSSWDIANAKSLGAFSINTWSYKAVCKSGNNYFAFADGSQTDTWSSETPPVANSNPFSIGKTLNAYYYAGYWTEFLAIKGLALYTEPFTPPTGPYILSNIKKKSGVEYASIKKVSGVGIANVKKVSGVQ